MPDIPDTPFMEINLSSINDLLEYESKRDYLRSGINVAMKEVYFGIKIGILPLGVISRLTQAHQFHLLWLSHG